MSIIKAADRYVGAPYKPRGRDPNGWDCWGCVRWCRKEFFGKESPSWEDAYNAVDFTNPEIVERVIRSHMEGWSEVPVRPGVVLLFRTFNRDAHVGLYLGDNQFIHTLYNCLTAIIPLEDWKHRLVAAYDTD